MSDIDVNVVSNPLVVISPGGTDIVMVSSSPSQISVVVGGTGLVAISAEASQVISVEATGESITVAVPISPIIQLVVGQATASGEELLYQAVGPISGNRVVVYDVGAAGWVYADRTTPAHSRSQLAVSIGAISPGFYGSARISGVMDEPSWAWPAPCMLWLDVNGFLTSTPPTVGFIREVAHAVTPTRIVIEPEPAINLN